MKKHLIELQEKITPFLKNRDYSFIAPEDDDLRKNFMLFASDYAPGDLFANSIHKALSNRDATLAALEHFGNDVKLRIFIVSRPKDDGDFIVHSTVEEYCQKHGINFQ